MATSKKNSTAQAPAAPAAVINLALLVAIAEATFANSYLHVSAEDVKPLVDQALVIQNPGIADASGALATKTTDAGNAYLTAHSAEVAALKASAAPAAAPATQPATPAATAKAKMDIKIVDNFELPAARRTGPTRGESYPFGQLAVGQAFFIPATAEKPNPERSYASTVTSAKDRYATVVEGQMRTNRKGRSVPVVTLTRDFAIRRLDDGAAFGQPGVAGAVIKRTA